MRLNYRSSRFLDTNTSDTTLTCNEGYIGVDC